MNNSNDNNKNTPSINTNYIIRNSHQRCSMRKSVLRNFSKYKGKHLHQSLFFNKVVRLWHRCFPVNFVKFLRANFYIEHLWATASESININYIINCYFFIGLLHHTDQLFTQCFENLRKTS